MENDKKKLPFFAKFLEDQLKNEEVRGGGITEGIKDLVVTHKYPSDSDEITSIKTDLAVTQKYPSDSDEVSAPMMDEY